MIRVARISGALTSEDNGLSIRPVFAMHNPQSIPWPIRTVTVARRVVRFVFGFFIQSATLITRALAGVFEGGETMGLSREIGLGDVARRPSALILQFRIQIVRCVVRVDALCVVFFHLVFFHWRNLEKAFSLSPVREIGINMPRCLSGCLLSVG